VIVEQHEYRFNERRVRSVAKANQRVDVDQREIAGARGDACNRVLRSAGNVGRDRETSEPNKPLADAIRKGGARIDRASRENWIATVAELRPQPGSLPGRNSQEQQA